MEVVQEIESSRKDLSRKANSDTVDHGTWTYWHIVDDDDCQGGGQGGVDGVQVVEGVSQGGEVVTWTCWNWYWFVVAFQAGGQGGEDDCQDGGQADEGGHWVFTFTF